MTLEPVRLTITSNHHIKQVRRILSNKKTLFNERFVKSNQFLLIAYALFLFQYSVDLHDLGLFWDHQTVDAP